MERMRVFEVYWSDSTAVHVVAGNWFEARCSACRQCSRVDVANLKRVKPSEQKPVKQWVPVDMGDPQWYV